MRSKWANKLKSKPNKWKLFCLMYPKNHPRPHPRLRTNGERESELQMLNRFIFDQNYNRSQKRVGNHI